MNKDERLEFIRSLAEKLGKTPTKLEMDNSDGPCVDTYLRDYGSWRKAVEAAGLVPNNRGRRRENKL